MGDTDKQKKLPETWIQKWKIFQDGQTEIKATKKLKQVRVKLCQQKGSKTEQDRQATTQQPMPSKDKQILSK